MEDIKNKDSDDEDEDLEALRMAALATLKSREKKNEEPNFVSYPSPINSIITGPCIPNQLESRPTPFANLFNAAHPRRNFNNTGKRWERGPYMKTSRRSNLIVINPVGDEGSNQKPDAKEFSDGAVRSESQRTQSAAKLLPQFRYCGSGNEDSMSPKTLRKTGPSRFNRHDSDSESSSDYDEKDSVSGDDSGSNETVLQDEPPELPSAEREGGSLPVGVEKQRRLSFQSLESEIPSEKSETVSVYNCLKNASSSYSRSDSFTSVQDHDTGAAAWNSSAQNNYTTLNQYSSQSYSTEQLASIDSENKRLNNIQSYVSDCPQSGNSYYTKRDTSNSDTSKENADRFCRNTAYSDHADNVFSRGIPHAKNIQYEQVPTLSRDDLRLELKKRLKEFGTKSTDTSSDPVQAFIDDNLRHCAEGKLQINTSPGAETNENTDNFSNKNRYRRSYSRERFRDEHSSRTHERSLSRERNRSTSRDRNINEYDSVYSRRRYVSSHREFRRESVSHHSRNTHEQSRSPERNRRNRSSSDESSRDRSPSRRKGKYSPSTSRTRKRYDRSSSRERVIPEKNINLVEAKHKPNAYEDKSKLDHNSVKNITSIDHTQNIKLKIENKNVERSWSDRSSSNERQGDKRSLSPDRRLSKNIERSWSDRSVSKERPSDKRSLSPDRRLKKNNERSWSDRSVSRDRLGDKRSLSPDRRLTKNNEKSWSNRSVSRDRLGAQSLNQGKRLSKNRERSWSDRSVSRDRLSDKRSLSQDRQLSKNNERSWLDQSVSKDKILHKQSEIRDKYYRSKSREKSWSDRSVSKERFNDKQNSSEDQHHQSRSKNKRSWSDRSVSKDRNQETESLSKGKEKSWSGQSVNNYKAQTTELPNQDRIKNVSPVKSKDKIFIKNKTVDNVSPSKKTLNHDKNRNCSSKYDKQQDLSLSPQKKSSSPGALRSNFSDRDHGSSPSRRSDHSSSYEKKHHSSKKSKHQEPDQSPIKEKKIITISPSKKSISKNPSRQQSVIDMFSPDDISEECLAPIVKKHKIEHLVKIPAVGTKLSDISEEAKQERRKERFQQSNDKRDKLQVTSRKNRSRSPAQSKSSLKTIRNKRSYSKDRSNSPSSDNSWCSSKNKVQSVSSVIKPVVMKSSEIKKKETLTVTKPLGKISLGSIYPKRQDSEYPKITIKTERFDSDQKSNLQSDANKRVPVHMRLGRKRVIQVNKDVEAAFVNSSSSSDSETVSTKHKIENICVPPDISGDKSRTGIFVSEKNPQKSPEKIRRLKAYS